MNNYLNKINILHCVYSMNRGGVETWLMHVLRNINRDRYQLDFCVQTDIPGDYDEEIRDLGSTIHHCSPFLNRKKYKNDLRRILQNHGPYSVVHSHEVIWNGMVMRLAHREGVPIRIANIHCDLKRRSSQNIFKKIYIFMSIRQSMIHATQHLICSQQAASSYLGKQSGKGIQTRILYCGEDFSAYEKHYDRKMIRKEFGIPEQSYVIGHVGGFRKEKNHQLIIEIASELAKTNPNVRFLLVGGGVLLDAIKSEVRAKGLDHIVIFTGVRSDIARLMVGAMDLFLFPSISEGLGLTLIEAQAAGLPCLFSDVISPEAELVKPLLSRYSLSFSAEQWAKKTLDLIKAPTQINKKECLGLVKSSGFNITKTIGTLEQLYRNEANNRS
jgi:glycosyltransferase involved in cell wall biosynthesis